MKANVIKERGDSLFSVKRPSISAVVPIVVPCTNTLAYGTLSALVESVTIPL